MAFSRTVRLAPVLLIPFFIAACVSQPGQKTEKPKPVAKTLTDGSPAILVTEDRSPQPRTATYSCANGVTMTIDPTQPAPRALQRLAEVLNLHVVQNGRHVELTAGAPIAP